MLFFVASLDRFSYRLLTPVNQLTSITPSCLLSSEPLEADSVDEANDEEELSL